MPRRRSPYPKYTRASKQTDKLAGLLIALPFFILAALLKTAIKEGERSPKTKSERDAIGCFWIAVLLLLFPLCPVLSGNPSSQSSSARQAIAHTPTTIIARAVAVPTATTEPSPTLAPVQIPVAVVTAREANVRSCGGMECQVLTTVKQDARLPLIALGEAWHQITLPDTRNGWISASIVRVEIDEGMVSAPPQAANQPMAVADNGGNVRYGPGANYPVVARLEAGQRVPVLGVSEARDWVQIEIDRGAAWMAANLLRFENVKLADISIQDNIPSMPEPPTPRPLFSGGSSGSSSSSSGGRTGARCNDGSYSGATGRGACSHHGGVATWLYR